MGDLPKLLTHVCKSCGARIYWARMPSGKANPIDVVRAGRQDGNVRLRRRQDDASQVEAEIVPTALRSERLWTSHFATCPKAAAYRRPDGRVEIDRGVSRRRKGAL